MMNLDELKSPTKDVFYIEKMPIKQLLKQFEDKFESWIKTKPTGKISFGVTVNQGGIRGNPKVIIEEDIKD